MPVLNPVKPESAPEPVQKIYARIRETLGNGEVPAGFQLMGQVEPFLSDSYMNYRKFIKEGAGKLDPKQREALVLATASAMNCTACVRHHAREAREVGWSETEVAEILALVATCTMYNTYYKFKELAGDARFQNMTPGLRAHTFQRVSLDQGLVELINVVVSNLNGCPACTSGHVQKALTLGVDHDTIDEAMKISAIMASFTAFHRIQ